MIDGKIYKMINTDNTLCYIGSTTKTLEQRKSKHVINYKNWKNGKYPFVTSFKVIENDKDGTCIFLLENVTCNSKEELLARERFYIDTLECVNKIKPTRTKQEYRNDNKEIIQKYYKDNRDRILERQKNNNNKNKAKLQEKHKCECGGTHTTNGKSHHIKTKKHQSFLQSDTS